MQNVLSFSRARFGMVAVDFDDINKTRTPRESFYWYQNVIANRCIDYDSVCSSALEANWWKWYYQSKEVRKLKVGLQFLKLVNFNIKLSYFPIFWYCYSDFWFDREAIFSKIYRTVVLPKVDWTTNILNHNIFNTF